MTMMYKYKKMIGTNDGGIGIIKRMDKVISIKQWKVRVNIYIYFFLQAWKLVSVI